MTKKNLLSLMLASALMLTLAACGEKSPSSSESGSRSETESTSVSGPQEELSEVVELTVGSERESAEEIPLDTKLKGKTVREETQWFSFTTDETENATYAITSVNQTPETSDLRLSVYDEEENQLNQYPLDAGQWGGAATLNLDLLPETTYYVKVWADKGDVISYSLILRSPDGQEPENNVAQPGPEVKDELEIFAATNQDDAQLIPLNARLDGKVSRGEGQWYAFSTNSAENATYRLTTVNMTRGTGALNLKVLNQYGEQMHQYTLNAEQSGKASTLDLELPPDTTYYIYLAAEKGDTIQYSLTVHAPEDGAVCGGKNASDTSSQGAGSSQPTEDVSTQENNKPDNGSLIVAADGLESMGEATEMLRGGTNQNEAVLLPLNTKLTGKTTQDGGLWYAFTTSSTENATYRITTVNKTLDTSDLCLSIYNAYGEKMHSYTLDANQAGRASTLDLELPASTTYYIYIWAEKGDIISYSLIIRDPEEQKSGYSTAGSVSESVGAVAGQEILAGTNQDEGGMIPLETEVSGKVSDGRGQWYAFTTNSVENATYEVTTVNKTPGTGDFCLRVYNMYGETMHWYSLNANQSGEAATESMQLSPKTTYYIYVWADKKDTIQYTLKIHGPEEQSAAGSVTVEEEPLVFETPFELNSTQVMFKAESDAFLDEAAAKEALKPVAEVILAHPDHPILLAGTTATDGDQQARVDLSNRRAAAVKNLLVSAFGVPEDQLTTIGLGFEADPFVRGQDRDANGKFIESEGAKNRRVIVMDANDPIAQE